MSAEASRDATMSVDALPWEAHKRLCTLGDRPDTTLDTVRDYASRYRNYLGATVAAHPERDAAELVSHLTVGSLRHYADLLVERIGPDETRRTMVKLRAALRAIFSEKMVPRFDAEYARLHVLAALPEHQAPRRRFRYAPRSNAYRPPCSVASTP